MLAKDPQAYVEHVESKYLLLNFKLGLSRSARLHRSICVILTMPFLFERPKKDENSSKHALSFALSPVASTYTV
ncbi:hypothetical protein M408DRAFT_328460 [Serendipita vermifera MAFF 305830]|uniref:Uncharacterized protein n=1 Tax=Serendipita vermifera MAFF 305830 TaxID=933852 RepID=A0A0C2WV51_SERVB|nr:hypothetical protein M408DRAFT_328460 [Serendipita vermifera MAFF 305830]